MNNVLYRVHGAGSPLLPPIRQRRLSFRTERKRKEEARINYQQPYSGSINVIEAKKFTLSEVRNLVSAGD